MSSLCRIEALFLAVHRATDTAGACGVGRAPRAGVAVFPERPRVGSLRAAGDVFCVQPRVAGAVEGGDSERRFIGRRCRSRGTENFYAVSLLGDGRPTTDL